MLGETCSAADVTDGGVARIRHHRPVLASGAVVKGYRVERLLGCGGMGLVYEATQSSLNRRVALKVLPAESAQDGVLQARFRREALLQAALDHPHIVDVYETGVCDAGLFIAMRLIRGDTLRAKIGPHGMDPDVVLELLSPVADALDTAHACGLVHRDVKPQNILVGKRAHAYLADFGLVRPFADRALTQAGGVLGTPAYLAPEIVHGSEATAASDIYSFAAVLHECLTGHPSTCRASLHGDIANVVERGLSAEPERRPASASELMRLADQALRPPVHRAPPAAVPPPSRAAAGSGLLPPRRVPSVVSRLLLGSCVLVLASLIVLMTAGQRERSTAEAGLSARIDLPVVVPKSLGAFAAEHGRVPGWLWGFIDEPGVAIEANVSVRGASAERLAIICVVHDLTAQRVVSMGTPVTPPPPGVTDSFTIACWLPVGLQPGHRYEAIVRIWHPSQGSASVFTGSTTF